MEGLSRLIDRYAAEDVFASVPELAGQTDSVLFQIEHVLGNEILFQQVRADLVRRYRWTAVHGCPSTLVEVLLRLLVVKHPYHWSFEETEERVLIAWCSAGSRGYTLPCT